jgi:threonine dehydrogenase-like Zn-dependent dehydrogenase
VCATDLALARGYMGFAGVPGHEFVGLALDGPLAGRRVVGEINAGCGACPTCKRGLTRHCPNRTVLGILGRSGAFAEELSLPTANLHALPDDLPDERAVFAEPLAAAFEIAEQLELVPGARALLVGDGRLGILCAHVLARHGLELTVAGHHPERRELLPAGARWLEEPLEPAAGAERFDLVVEATGRADVLPRALARVRPRGTLVLKTTTEAPVSLDLAPLVIDEVRLVGSRCGPFEPAIEALARGEIPVEGMIQARYPLDRGVEALRRAGEPGVLKVLIEMEA